MATRLPRKKPGDSVSAQHINDLSTAARKVLSPDPGSFFHNSGGTAGVPSPFDQRPMIVVYDEGDFDGDDYGTLLSVRPLYYDADTGEWETDDASGPWPLDQTVFPDLDLQLDDRVTAWWNPQREAFMPIVSGTGGGEYWIGDVTADLGDGDWEVTIEWWPCGGNPLTDQDTTYDTITAGVGPDCLLIENGMQVWGKYYENSGGYCQHLIDGACCPT